MKALVGWVVLLGLWDGSLLAADPTPLARTHAHNDYEHERPLLDALSHGFTSVEADVHLVDGQLLVAHDPHETRSGRTLTALYLEPLRERIRTNGGAVYAGAKPGSFLLLVDIKTEAEATYAALEKVLAPFRELLTRFTADQTIPGAVTIILSGNRPQQTVQAQAERFVAIDGRVPDLNLDPPASLVPLISDNWSTLFQWKGEGMLSDPEKEKLHRLVARAHAQKRKIRFWAVPDEAAAWRILRDAGVDLINTDKLAELEAFLRSGRAD